MNAVTETVFRISCTCTRVLYAANIIFAAVNWTRVRQHLPGVEHNKHPVLLLNRL